jgi:class 3 adenylate cyclase/DNA-binding winged helix-turn-helix (wHTH) protein/tetratricopeptide (TPR) repeat protein
LTTPITEGRQRTQAGVTLGDTLDQPASVATIYLFDQFRLDKLERQLLRQDAPGYTVPVLLGGRALDVLLALVERNGEIVSKIQIINAVWLRSAVEEANLTVQISALRRALDSGRHGPSLIRTVHGRGYLLAATVTRASAPSQLEVSSPTKWPADVPAGLHVRQSPSSVKTQNTPELPAFDMAESNPDLPKPHAKRDLPDNVAPAALGRAETLIAARSAELDESRSEPGQPEHRQLTVLACEVVGLAVFSTDLDLEQLRNATTACHLRVTEIIEGHRGLVANYGTDSVLAYFGYPQADEHDVERAVLAARALIEAIPKLKTAGGAPLYARVGVATGLVVTGKPPGIDAARTVTVVGETPNLAVRLQNLAGPDSLLVSEATRSQLGRLFECRHLGTVEVKGRGAVPVWQVLSENRTLGQFEALRSGATMLVGRDEEMDLLLRRWIQSRGGDGRVVLISAEPGVGKSRLADGLSARIAADPHVELRYFCSPHHQDTALYPVIAQMERAAGFLHSDEPTARLAKLQAVLEAASSSTEDIALITDLHASMLRDFVQPLGVTPPRNKEKTFEALMRQVEGLSRQQPVLVIFDDVHWIDPSSSELLDRVIGRVAEWPVLLLALFRPEFQPEWIGQPHVTTLTLARLDRRDTATMISNLAGDAALPPQIVEEIAKRTDGVPLFVEELTKAMLEAAAVPAPFAPSSTPTPALSVPATLHASLMARLDRLGSIAKEVVQAGAAIGREFEYGLLASISDLPEPQLRGALDRLTNSGLLFVRGAPPESSYIFKHALVQDASYATLLRSRRQGLHARITETLENRFPEVVLAQPALLARHCLEAGLAEKSVPYWLRAGQQAMTGSAMTEAAAQLRKGLDVLDAIQDGPWRQQAELDLQVAFGMALGATKGWSAVEVGETFARARALAQQLNRAESLVPLIAGRWLFHNVRAEYRSALQVAQQLEQIGETRNDAATQSLGRYMQGANRFLLGELVTARMLLEQCFGLESSTHRGMGGLSVDPYTNMLTYLALTLTCLGYLDQARSRIDEALSKTRKQKHVHGLAHALNVASRIDWLTGSPDLHSEELLALTTEQGFPFYLGWALAYRGRSLIAHGQAGPGLRLLAQGLSELRAIGSLICRPQLLTWLAKAHAMVGQPTEARSFLLEAGRIVETTDERFGEAEFLCRVPGDLLNIEGDRCGAERLYSQAIGVAERQSARLFQLRATTSLARLWRDQGKRAEGHNLLAPIYNWFTEGFDAPDLKDAKALLDELA